MQLQQLVSPWYHQAVPAIEINALCADSRAVKAGALFLAYPGTQVDARQYIEQAIAAGASAVLFEPKGFERPDGDMAVPCLPIENLAERLGEIAARFYDYPAAKLTIIGVTGTNGKTTIAYQLAQAYALLGKRACYIGTIGQGCWDALSYINNTTPGALELQALLADYAAKGMTHVCMEVSSHALSQHRTAGIRFTQAIFSNLSLDHLDYHETMEAYAAAKAKLFAGVDLGVAILNADDAASQQMRQVVAPGIPVYEYGRHAKAEFCLTQSKLALSDTKLVFTTPTGQVQSRIQSPGDFNVYNALAIAASLSLSGYKDSVIAELLPRLKAAPGRMECVLRAPLVFMDYAHTPDALENVLQTIKPLAKGRVLTVFGCGGDRDKSKRPLMAAVAARYSDLCIVTSDNPRTEAPEMIIQDILAGLPENALYEAIVDRREAMRRALELAGSQDIILLAGKGHETYQIIGEKKFDFDEKQIISELAGV